MWGTLEYMHYALCEVPSGVLCHRSHCHGNMRLNDDSESQRNIPIVSCVILNRMWLILRRMWRTILSSFIELLPYKVVLRAGGEGV